MSRFLKEAMQLSTRVVLLCLAVVGAITAAPAVQAQSPSRVAVLGQQAEVKAALEHIRTTESQTIADQIRFCEVPAPPFDEAARGKLLRDAFTRLGLENVRTDAVGNVAGERRGSAQRPHLLIAAHLDTVFPA